MTTNPTAERHHLHSAAPGEHELHDQGDLVAVRRNLLLSGVVGGLAALLGAAFLARGSWALDTALGLIMLAIAVVHLVGLASWRVPVLVADEQGIRLRLGLSWRGLPWSAIRQIVVEHPDSLLREGRMVVVPRDLAATGHALDPLGRVHLAWNRLWYGAPMSVPLGMSTITDSPDLAADLRALGDGVDVADLRGKQLAQLDEVPVRAREVPVPPAEDDAVEMLPGATLPGGMELAMHAELAGPAEPAVPLEPVDEETGPVFEDVAFEELPPPPEDDLDEPAPEPAPAPEVRMPAPVSPLRDISQPMRVDVVLPRRAPVEQDIEPKIEPQLAFAAEAMSEDVPDSGEPTAVVRIPGQRRPGEIAELLAGGELHDEIQEQEPAPGAVIGTKIAHAREMLDMSIDELSQRTRIRPHVLEAMERDDFGPCGGDVYARGHLTSVARVLGLNNDALMELYDERYSQGPINARRVFEADLSTGMSGGMRATLGGPRWSLLISAVLCLTMVWGLARLFSGDGEQLNSAPDPSSQVAGLAGNHEPITSPLTRTSKITVSAKYAGTHLIVRDRSGRILWSGDLALGRKRTIAGVAPFKVQADNAGAVEVLQKGKSLGTIGMAGEAASKKFG